MLNQYLCDRYLLIKELSHKANRRTFLATDTHCPSPVIIKIIQFGSTLQWTDLKLFEREANILKHIHHPSIPQYREYFETEIEGVSSFVLVQNYIEAPSLSHLVQSGTLFLEAEIVEIARQLLNTLNYLHRQLPPVVHRDIKPSNILISRPSPRATVNITGVLERTVYLVDFGAVQIAASKNSGTVTVVGSYGYMPMEQFVGQTTPASDLYSLGMTLLYLATGSHPADMPQVDGQILVEEIALSAGLSESFSHWLAQMTRPYTDRRFESAAIALAHLTAKGKVTGYYSHLKPKSSTFRIHRQKNKLEIINEHKSRSIAEFGCMLFIPLLFLCFTAGSIAGPLGVLLMVVAGAGLLRWKDRQYRAAPNGYEIISISHERGIQAATVWGKSLTERHYTQWKGFRMPFHSINFLTYTPEHLFIGYYQAGRRGRQSYESGNITVPPKLSIHTGRHEYCLYPDSELSEAELRWLDAELSDFLGRSIQVLNPKDQNSVVRTRSQSPILEEVEASYGLTPPIRRHIEKAKQTHLPY